ncbi:DAN protein, partial [Acromyrmex insinuator]
MPRTESRQAGKRPLRALTPQEKIDAINRVHNGESKAAVARDIGVPESTLRGWCKAEEKILSQANNLKTSVATLPGTSLGFEHVLTSSSDNSNNSAVGGGSSSRSTPTTQAMLGLPSTSGVIERTDEFEAGPAHKRMKHENNSAGTTMANNNMALSKNFVQFA